MTQTPELYDPNFSSEFPTPSSEVAALCAPLEAKVRGSQFSWASYGIMSSLGDQAVYPNNSDQTQALKNEIVSTIVIDTNDLVPLIRACQTGILELDGTQLTLSVNDLTYIERTLRSSMEFFWGYKLLGKNNEIERAVNNSEEFKAVMTGLPYETDGIRFWSRFWDNPQQAANFLEVLVEGYKEAKKNPDEELADPVIMISTFRQALANEKLSGRAKELGPEIAKAYERSSGFMNFELMKETVRIVIEELGFTSFDQFLTFMHGQPIDGAIEFANTIVSSQWINHGGIKPTYFEAYGAARTPVSHNTGSLDDIRREILRNNPLQQAIQQIAADLGESFFSTRGSTYVATAIYFFLPEYRPAHILQIVSRPELAQSFLTTILSEHSSGVNHFTIIRQIDREPAPHEATDFTRQDVHEKGHEVEAKYLMALERANGLTPGNLRLKVLSTLREVASIMDEAIGSPEFRSVWGFLTPLNAARFLNEMHYWNLADRAYQTGQNPTLAEIDAQMELYAARVEYLLDCKDFPRGRILDGYAYYIPTINSLSYAIGGIIGPVLAKRVQTVFNQTFGNSETVGIDLELLYRTIASAKSMEDLMQKLGIDYREVQEAIAWYTK